MESKIAEEQSFAKSAWKVRLFQTIVGFQGTYGTRNLPAADLFAAN